MNKNYIYFPGCTLFEKTKEFDKTIRFVANILGVNLIELNEWYCCGAVLSTSCENLITLSSPIRNLNNAKKEGYDKFVTVCSGCFNVHKRANEIIKKDKDKREKINLFIEEEYSGEVEILHLLEIIKDDVRFENLKNKTKKQLSGLKIAPYYGCLLLRPKEIAIDDRERPTMIDELMKSIGCEVIDFPYKTECCGAYLTVSSDDVVVRCSYNILNSAKKSSADAIVTTCPLCFYNFDVKQKDIKEKYSDFKEIPVFYFTELMAIALGAENLNFSEHYIKPDNLLRDKNLL